jgi:hypothetical protein
MAQQIVRHFTPHILRRNIRTTAITRSSEYPTRSPYDFPSANKTFDTFDNIVKETASATSSPSSIAADNAEEITRHHFDTYRIVQGLEAQGFTKEQAVVVMKGMKFKLRER